MISVLIAVPFKLTRECLRVFLEREKDICILALTDGNENTIALIRQLNPDVVLLDIDTQRSKDLETVHDIMFQTCKSKVVVMGGAQEFVSRGEFIKAGVKGYYCWRDPLSEVVAAIRAVHAGHIHISPTANVPASVRQSTTQYARVVFSSQK